MHGLWLCKRSNNLYHVFAQGVYKKKSCTWDCFISIRSHDPPPLPIFPKKEINHKTKHRPYAYIWPKSSVWLPLYLSSPNHPPWDHSRLKWYCMILVFVVIKSLLLDYNLQAAQWSKSLSLITAPYHLHKQIQLIGMNETQGWSRHKCTNSVWQHRGLAWQPGGHPDV